jgi:ribosome-associated translation inhibitor RaiA
MGLFTFCILRFTKDIVSQMNELDFTIEFNSENLSENAQAELFAEADRRLRKLADGHTDLTGAAINVRQPAKGQTAYLHEATVVVYCRPENVAATEKKENPMPALKGALSAVERQVREKRTRLKKHWERPGNHPVEQEVTELLAAGDPEMVEDSEETSGDSG